jgi:hypothetical protein
MPHPRKIRTIEFSIGPITPIDIMSRELFDVQYRAAYMDLGIPAE